MFVTESGYLFEIIAERSKYFLVEWCSGSIYGDPDNKPEVNIVHRDLLGNYKKVNSFEQYCKMFGPKTEMDYIQISLDKRYNNLMSGFSEDDKAFIESYLMRMSQPRA